jgi:glucokinase
MKTDPSVVAIDIGGTKIAGGLVTAGGQIHALRRIPTEAHQGGEDVMRRVNLLVGELIAEGKRMNGALSPAAIGVGTAGWVEPKSGVITFATSALPGWKGMPVKERLQTAHSLPAFVENDAAVMALGEAVFGAGRGRLFVLGLTVGTGIGGGIIIDGQIYHGAHGYAGAMGHIIIDYRSTRQCPCGRYGCMEAYASTPGLVNEFIQAVGREYLIQHDLDPAGIGIKEIADLAKAGNANAWQVIQHGAEYLGTGIATLLNLFNPDIVVIGGGVANIGAPYFEKVRQVASTHALPTVAETLILPAQLGDKANLVGAACLADQGL